MKKILILSLGLVLIGGGFIFYYTQIRQQAKISTTLSERAQKFVKKQQQGTGETELKFVNLDGPVGVDTRNTRVGKEACYSFVIPYRVTVTKFEDNSGNICSTRISFDNPKGAIVSYIYKKPVASWDDVSGVLSRQRKKDEYSEEKKTLNGKTFLMFRLKNDLYEKSAFYYTAEYFFVFNLITKTNENLDEDFDKMLESLEFEENFL